MHMMSLEDFRRLPQIADAPIGAAADDDLLNRQPLHFADDLGVAGQVRQGDGRFKRGEVNFHRALVFRVGVGFICRPRTVNAPENVLNRLFVHRENAVLAACFNRHIRNREAVIHGQIAHALACELDALVQRTVHANQPNQVEDNVLAGDVGAHFARQHHFDGAWHAEPVFARCHARRHIGRADTGRERAERAVSAGVAVRADNQFSRRDDALFRQQRMFNADLPDVEEVGNLESAGEIARGLAQLGGLDVLARRVVIQHDGDFILVEHAGEAGFVKHADGDGSRYVIAEHEVELCLNQVARFDFGQPRVGGEDFLRHGHSHGFTLLPSRAAQHRHGACSWR